MVWQAGEAVFCEGERGYVSSSVAVSSAGVDPNPQAARHPERREERTELRRGSARTSSRGARQQTPGEEPKKCICRFSSAGEAEQARAVGMF